MFKTIYNMVEDWLIREDEPTGFPMCDFERIRYELRPCDVLLIEGRSRISEVIKAITQSSWSHAALYVGRLHDIEDDIARQAVADKFDGEPNAQLLIEGMAGQGTIVTPLSFYKKEHIRICRPKGLSPQDAQRVISYACGRLGEDYDLQQILDLMRFFFPWTILPRRWRSSLFQHNIGQTTRTICSTMIADAFNSVDFPVLPLIKKSDKTGIEFVRRNPKLFVPKDFDYSPYFEIIKYPFVEFADQAMYRRLPWNREGLISNDDSEEMVVIEDKEAIKLAITAEESSAPRVKDKQTEVTAEDTAEVSAKPSAPTDSSPKSEHAPDPEQALQNLTKVLSDKINQEADMITDSKVQQHNDNEGVAIENEPANTKISGHQSANENRAAENPEKMDEAKSSLLSRLSSLYQGRTRKKQNRPDKLD